MADSKPQPKTQQKAQPKTPQKRSCCGMENCLESTKMLFLHPTQFFNSVSGVSGYLHVLKFFAVFIIISSLLGLVPSFMLGAVDAFTLGWTVLSILLTVFVSPFIGAAIVHLGVLICGGKQGFFNTFKADTYGGIVFILYGMLMTILSIAFYALNPSVVELMKTLSATALTGESAALISANMAALSGLMVTLLPFLLLTSLIMIVGVIHTVYAVVVGLSLFQKMSKLRALGAVLIAIVIVFAIVMLMGAFIYSLFLSIPNLSPLSAGPF